MSNATDWFAKTPRGEPLNGPRAIAGHIWGDPERWRSVYLLPREDYGIGMLPGGLIAYTGWLDAALARNAGKPGSKRRGAAARRRTPRRGDDPRPFLFRTTDDESDTTTMPHHIAPSGCVIKPKNPDSVAEAEAKS